MPPGAGVCVFVYLCVFVCVCVRADLAVSPCCRKACGMCVAGNYSSRFVIIATSILSVWDQIELSFQCFLGLPDAKRLPSFAM